MTLHSIPIESLQDAGAGLLAAAMIAVVPGYISRSVAGSYDNEGMHLMCDSMLFKQNITHGLLMKTPHVISYSGIAIFCMLLTYYMWIKAVKTGSVYWSSICALAYFYMVRRCV